MYNPGPGRDVEEKSAVPDTPISGMCHATLHFPRTVASGTATATRSCTSREWLPRNCHNPRHIPGRPPPNAEGDHRWLSLSKPSRPATIRVSTSSTDGGRRLLPGSTNARGTSRPYLPREMPPPASVPGTPISGKCQTKLHNPGTVHLGTATPSCTSRYHPLGNCNNPCHHILRPYADLREQTCVAGGRDVPPAGRGGGGRVRTQPRRVRGGRHQPAGVEVELPVPRRRARAEQPDHDRDVLVHARRRPRHPSARCSAQSATTTSSGHRSRRTPRASACVPATTPTSRCSMTTP